jgi:tetratricopeptide (TPR) repeat protein
MTYKSLVGLAAAVVLVTASRAAVAQQDAPASNPQTVFFKANAHYHEGAYEEAVKDYNALVDSGMESGNLYFNLGNAYFKLGDVGKAIVNYERAERLIPADPDLAANLSYARSLTGAEPCEVPFWRRAAFPLRGRMSTTTLAWWVSGLCTLTFAALILQRLVRLPGRSVLYVAGGFASLTFVALLSLADQLVVDEWQQHAVVVGAKETAARFEPAADGTVHFTLPEGTEVQVTEEREGWLQIARCDGRRGWVPAAALDSL